MKILLSVFVAILLSSIIFGCDFQVVRTQEKQAAQINKLIKIVKQQNREIALLRKQRETTKISSRDKMINATLVLVKYGNGTVVNYATSILGRLGGKQAEKTLLEMLENKPQGISISHIISALVAMRSNKLRTVINKFLQNDNINDLNQVINAISNRGMNIFTKSDLPMLDKVLAKIPNSNYNNNRHIRNNLIGLICRLDKNKGAEYIYKDLETANPNEQNQIISIFMRNRMSFGYKFWKKIIEIIGEPNNQNIGRLHSLYDGIGRCGDLRLTDEVLPWAELTQQNVNFKNQYINMLNRMRDPKAAKIFLELCSNTQGRNNYTHYLNNFPGIIKKDGKYQLVDDATMKKILARRAKRIARLNEMDKKKSTKKEHISLPCF